MKSLAPISAVVAIVLLLLGAYVGGYLLLGERIRMDVGDQTPYLITERRYPFDWQRKAFEPAAGVERWITGEYVYASYVSPERLEEIRLGIPAPPGDWDSTD